MEVDNPYCMSSYLTFRAIVDPGKAFREGIVPNLYKPDAPRETVRDEADLELLLRREVGAAVKNGKAALALSGGIDSAILARFMPEGSTAYTFRCVVPGVKVTDETEAAALHAEACGLKHKIIEIDWQDVLRLSPVLMRRKGAPIHSIEVQICKAAQRAKQDGFETLIFGESADCLYGGQNGLFSRDWGIDAFARRFTYVSPERVLRDPVFIREPFIRCSKAGIIDIVKFMKTVYFNESVGSYSNACKTAGVELCAPYSCGEPEKLDLARIRAGESKYMVRNIFSRLYPGFFAPVKRPMPRPTDEWMSFWKGPLRKEFLPDCTDGLSGDQKWMVFCLEWFLNLVDEGCFGKATT